MSIKKKIKETQYSVNSEVTAQTINTKPPHSSFILPLLLGKYQQIIKSSFIETAINLF